MKLNGFKKPRNRYAICSCGRNDKDSNDKDSNDKDSRTKSPICVLFVFFCITYM